ncbi:hypothetical protein JCM9492_09050 [Aquifex pyrophilus]
MGVGLGSNRPSSLITYLISQVGILGTLFFTIFIIQLLKNTYTSLKKEKFEYFFLIPSVILCQILSYPDITNPTLWQFIYVVSIIYLISKAKKLNMNTTNK